MPNDENGNNNNNNEAKKDSVPQPDPVPTAESPVRWKPPWQEWRWLPTRPLHRSRLLRRQ
jgi:hypothetical protein